MEQGEKEEEVQEEKIQIDKISDDPERNPAWLPDPGNLPDIHSLTDSIPTLSQLSRTVDTTKLLRAGSEAARSPSWENIPSLLSLAPRTPAAR